MLKVREIKEILKREHLSISRRRGQNFLVDETIRERIITAADVKPDEAVLEIGPGLGALTEELIKKAGYLCAVEKDIGFAAVLQKKFSGSAGLQIVSGDILKFNIERVAEENIKVVGNLPYYISTPILGYLLEDNSDKISEIFITVQDEVGKRMLAHPGCKDYSALSLFIRYFTLPELLFSIPKRAFYPQPGVNSVFIHLAVLKQPPVKANNPQQLFKIIRACFNQRRKTILNSLTHKLGRIEKDRIHRLLQKTGIDLQSRPERLSLEEFAEIEEAFYKGGVRL
jgi:16S rRNA (adenine1518-N6/adenine1519-N6)-dimethyltransferase